MQMNLVNEIAHFQQRLAKLVFSEPLLSSNDVVASDLGGRGEELLNTHQALDRCGLHGLDAACSAVSGMLCERVLHRVGN